MAEGLRRLEGDGSETAVMGSSVTKPIIELRGVGKVFVDSRAGTTFRALSDVDLDVGRGEFISIVGPSGCGKTTLLKIVAGLVTDYEGDCLIGGDVVRGPTSNSAMVFQNFSLLPWRTVRKNVAFGLNVKGIKGDEAAAIIDSSLESVGLSKFADAYPTQLSGGMQQRVGLARALAVDPEILLMDEPFGALDALTRQVLQDDLLGLWQRSGKSVVFVTHDIGEAIYLSDRVVVMGMNPGAITRVVDVDLPRPRDNAARQDPRYTKLAGLLWSELEKHLQVARNGGATA